MKLVWNPEAAAKAYIDTVKFICSICIQCELIKESSVAELISATAAGWDARLIVETWYSGGHIATSIGLSIASRHTGGRHVCVVPDEDTRTQYIEAMSKAGIPHDVVVGEPEEVMEGFMGVDFLVVDCSHSDFTRTLRAAKLSHRGAVLVGKNSSSRAAAEFKWRSVLDGGSCRIVRSVSLPVGMGLDIAHVAATSGGISGPGKGESRWFKHVDRQSGEVYVIRKSENMTRRVERSNEV